MNYRKFWFKNFSFGCLALLLFAFLSCGEDSGLGGAIDTKSPTLSIDYPPSGAAIRDSFVLFGNVSDDKSIDKVLVSIRNLEMDGISDDYTATVSEDSKSWSIELNRHDDLASDYFNGWQYPDGKYEVYVTAYDHAGNNSGKSSRSFEIDNTAPVFIISNPGVVKKSGLSPSAYGSIFTIDGTISDNHAISFMDVKIFNSNGELISFESYEGENIDFYREEEIATAGGTSVQIAQAGNVLNSRYSQLHPSDSGTEFYYAQITLTDSAKVYKNPPAASSRSAEDLKSDALGNSTSKIYLYDDVYTSVMSAKKGINSKNGGFSAANLKDILAGVEKGAVESQALEILNEKAIDTSAPADSDSMANKLSFSLNPEANPTYNVNGFSFFNADDSIQSASSGNTVSVTISAGLDGTNIAPEKVRVWMKAFDEKPGDSEKIKGDLRNLEKKVEALEKSDSVFQDAIHKSEDSPATLVKTEEKENDWLLIYDYSLNNSKGSSVATKTFSVTLPDGISLSKYYILGVTGCDIEDVEFAQNTVYGFVGNTAGVPPTITFDSPKNFAVFKDFSAPAFKGSAAFTSSMLYLTELTATLSITDESTGESVGHFSDKISCRLIDDQKIWALSDFGALTFDNAADSWSLDLTKIPELSRLYEEKSPSGILWLASLTVSGKSSSGHEGESTRSIHIDTVAPKVTISSAEPHISDFDGQNYDYLNELVRIKGSVEEGNPDQVTYDILASTDLTKTLSSESDSILEKLRELDSKYTGSLGKGGSIDREFDTGKITEIFATDENPDPKIQFDILICAKDTAGNATEYHLADDKNLTDGKKFVIYQETDRPKIVIGNASAEIEKVTLENNYFGVTSNNSLQISFSDDDCIAECEIWLYDENGKTLLDSDSEEAGLKVNGKNGIGDFAGKNPYKFFPGKTSASINYLLPSTVAKYQVKILARDYLSTDLNKSFGEKTLGLFPIAVDSGAPKIEISSPASGSFQGEKVSVSGSLSKKAEVRGLIFKDGLEVKDAGFVVAESELTQDSSGLYKWQGEAKTSGDGEYSVKIRAVDSYGQEASEERAFRFDKTAPEIKINEQPESGYSTSTLIVKGSVTDANLKTSAFKVSLIPSDETKATKIGVVEFTEPEEGSNEYKWEATFTNLQAKYTLKVAAFDLNGNSSELDGNTFMVDLEGPEISGAIKAGISQDLLAEAGNDGTFFVNDKNSLYIRGKVSDYPSGMKETAWYSLYENISVNEQEKTVADESKVSKIDLGADGSFTINIDKSKITKSGVIKAVFFDKAGNYTKADLLNITYDPTAPKIQSAQISDKKDGFTACESEKITVVSGDSAKKYRNFYINSSNKTWTETDGEGNTVTHSQAPFTISGVATDNLGLREAKLELAGAKMENEDGGTVKDVFVIRDEEKLSNWSFDGLDLTGLTSGALAKITLTDKAGNSTSEEIYIQIDKEKPAARHEYDAKKKDLYFRVGKFDNELSELHSWKAEITSLDANLDRDVGGKYQTGTWGTASTITIRGYWEEAGSGVKTIYYKIFTSTASNAEDLKNEIAEKAGEFAKNYLTDNNGNFAPLKENVTKRVAYSKALDENGETSEQAFKEIESSYMAEIPGFDSEKNYLLLLAIDNVGNAAIDSLGAAKVSDVAGELDSSDWNSGLAAFSLNVDTVAPSLISTTSGSVYTNGLAPVKVCFDESGNLATGEASDSSSGVKSVVLTIEDVKDENNNPLEVTVAANLEKVAGNASKKKWSATILKDSLSKLKGNSNYNVSATVRDLAGNKSSSQIFTLMVDKDAPVVSMVSPAYSGSEAAPINGKISVKGTTEYEAAPPSRLELYYTTSQPQSGSEEQATSLSSLTQIGSAITDVNKIFSWTFSGFNSYDVFTESEIASNKETKDVYIIPVVYDVAGNCSIYTEDESGKKTYSYSASSDEAAGTVQNYFKYTVDKNTDRPLIKLGNCDVSGSALKSTSKAYGTIEDDDGLDGLNLFYIMQSDFDPAKLPAVSGNTVTLNGWTQAQIKSGSWEIDSGAEGNFSYYLYAIDAEGGHFWSKAAHSLSQMYVYNGVNEKDEKKSENAGISFSADLNPPEIESLEIAHKSLEAASSEGWSAVTETYGPTDKDLYVKLVVSEAIGLAEKSSPATENLIDRLSIPALTIDGKNVAVSLLSATSESGSKSLASGSSYSTTFYTFLFDPIDLSDSSLALSGAKTLKVTVTDKSGFTAQGTIGVTYDNAAPTIKIISPTATISDAVIAATTIKGTAFDDFSAIKKLEYAVPLKGQSAAYTKNSDNWTTIGSSTATWEIEYDSGSPESQSSLLYYAAHPDLYEGVEEVTQGLGIYAIPFYFRTTDSVGNVEVHKSYREKAGDSYVDKPFIVYANPDGGKPSAWINAPESGITTSGSVTVYGGAMDNISVKTVCLQIDGDGDGDIDEADYTDISSRLADFGLESGSLVASSEKGGVKQNDWYIKADGTNSWKCIIKSSGIKKYTGTAQKKEGVDLIPSSDTKETRYLIAQVRAIDNDENTRKYTKPNVVVIDNTAPWFSNVRLVQFGKEIEAGSANEDQIVTEREYKSGMFVSHVSTTGTNGKGQWYLLADVESNSSFESISAEKLDSQTSTVIPLAGTDADSEYFFLKTSDNTKNHLEEASSETAGNSKYKLYVPLKTNESGVIYAILKAKNAVGTGEQTIKINIDSTAPTLYTNVGAETENATTYANMRVKSQNKILGKDLDKNSVIENSDGYFVLGDTVKEAGSGLSWVAFYFENDIKGKVYDPMIKVSGSTYGGTELQETAENGKVYVNEDNLAALYLTGVTRNSETTLTLPEENAHVRKGGLVKIAGTYHTISDVSGSEVTFSPALSVSFQTVEVIYAQVVDHTVTENIITDYNEEDVGTERIESDDGDGMCEILTQQGSFYNWTAYVDSNNIPDGTTYIRVVAMDEAGNLSHGKIVSIVANNRPRLTKVFIGTDLNGNGKFDFDADEGDAPVVSTSNKLRTKSGTSYGEFNYYTAYNTRSGAAQSKVTLDSTAFKVIDGLCIVPEFTGGNGSLKYTLTNGTDLNPYAGGELKEMIPRTSSKINNVGNLSLFGNTPITDGDNKNAVTYGITDSSAGTSYKDFGGIVIENSDSSISAESDGQVKNVKVTFFDNTDSTDGSAHANGQWATVVIPVTIKSSDSTVPQPRIMPFHWSDSSDNSLYVKKNGNTYEAASATEKNGVIAGHIELEGALPTDANLTANLPKVSGIIKVEGRIYDDVRLESISMSIFGGDNTKVADYTNGSWVNAASFPTGLISFSAVDEDMSQKGHTVKYTAVVNTELLSESGYPVGKAKWITVGASDWKHNSADSERYSMDVVPYVTEIVTHLSAFYRQAPSVYARTALGKYPVYEGERIQFKGYNLGTNVAKVRVSGMTEIQLSTGNVNGEQSVNSIALTSDAKSGEVSVTVNGIPAVNNKNVSTATYNLQPNGVNNNILSDDINLDVWQFVTAAEPRNGKSDNPTMKVSSRGRIGISFSNAVVYFSAPFIDYGDSQSVDNIKSQTAIAQNYGWFTNNTFCFDQYGYPYAAAQSPDTDTAIGAAFLQFFSRQAGDSINNMGLNENYQKIANSARIEADCIPIDSNESNWTTDIDRTQSLAMATSMKNPSDAPSSSNQVTVHMAYWDNLTKQIRYRYAKVGENPGDFGNKTYAGKNYDSNNELYFTTSENLDSMRDLQGLGSSWERTDKDSANENKKTHTYRFNHAYDSVSTNDNNHASGQHIYRVAGTSLGSGYATTYQKTTKYQGGKYVDIGVLPSTETADKPTVVICWYDGINKNLVLSYDTPSDSDQEKENNMYKGKWQTNAGVASTRGGNFCRMAIDADDGIHIAHYDSTGADLLYTYVPVKNSIPQIAKAVTVTVDSFLSVGTWCTIDVAKEYDSVNDRYNHVPQIGYFVPACESTSASARVAYPVKFDSNGYPVYAGTEDDMFTGNWEITTVPTEGIPIINRVNVGLYKTTVDNTKGVLAAIPTGGTNRKTTYSVNKPSYPVSDSTTVFGNGTLNPAVVYCLDDGIVQLAQKK